MTSSEPSISLIGFFAGEINIAVVVGIADVPTTGQISPL